MMKLNKLSVLLNNSMALKLSQNAMKITKCMEENERNKRISFQNNELNFIKNGAVQQYTNIALAMGQLSFTFIFNMGEISSLNYYRGNFL